MLYLISVSVCEVAYGWYALHTGDSWYLSGWKLVCLYWIQCIALMCAVVYLEYGLLWILQNRRSVAVWWLGVRIWYWKHRVSGDVLGGRRLVVWRVPQSRRWCFLWESWDQYLLRSCRIHSGTLWFHRTPLDCQECMGSVLHVLMLGAMLGRCYSYTTLLSCHRHQRSQECEHARRCWHGPERVKSRRAKERICYCRYPEL